MSDDDKLAVFAAGVAELDARSLMTGLYLVGSHALGDVCPDSDIDFLGVLARPPEPVELSALRLLHGRLGDSWPTPHLDGAYVLAEDLRGPAEDATPLLRLLQGEEVEPPRGGVTPVEWFTLRTRGVRLLGAPIAELDVAADVESLRAFCRRNLVEYWRPLVERLAELAAVESMAGWVAYMVPWVALGAPRLVATIATGEVLSKTEAGRYAWERFPQWRGVLEASLEQRYQPRHDGTARLSAMAPDVVALGRRCIEVGLSS